MTPLKHSNNIAARMGRWSASHWKTAVFGWLAFVVVATFVGTALGTKNIDVADVNVGETHRADQILKDNGFGQTDPQTEIVVIQSSALAVTSPAFRAAVNDVVHAVKPFKTIKNLRSPLDPAHGDQVSADGHTALVEFDMKGDNTVATNNIDPIVAATTAVAKKQHGIFIGEAGSISSGKAINKMFTDQLAQAGERSIPLTLVILLLVFGAIVAAGVPLLLALSAVVGTLGLLSVPSRLIPMDQNVSAVVLLIGLAVGVDYALFYIRREREERAAGKGHRAALEAAAATSGRSVLISGVTVMAAMAGMFLTGDKSFMSFAVGTIVVVGVAMLGSLTVLPALLSRLGDRVEKGRIPFIGRLRRPAGENRFWSAILTPALRHPVVSVVFATTLLVVLAVPVLRLHTAQSGLDSIPKSTPTVAALDRLDNAFPGTAEPALVAVRADTDSAAFKNAANELRALALKSGVMHGPVNIVPNASHTAARIEIPFAGSGVDKTSNKALAELRDNLLPATLGQVPGATYAVGGATAASTDANAVMKHAAPLVFGFVLLFAFLLLLVSFRSIVVAGEGDRAQPAVGRCRLRCRRRGVPVRLG